MSGAVNYIIFFIWMTLNQRVQSTLLDQINFFVNQNRYTLQPTMFQTKFSMDNVMGSSLDMALQSCQNDFKWERWNCPSTDFFLRRTSVPYRIDREDAYVAAITTAALLYTITKDCSSGVLTNCGCESTTISSTSCSDDPEEASILYSRAMKQNSGDDFRNLVHQHNYKAVTTLLGQSLIRQCGCSDAKCVEKNCVNVLKPFNEIASEIKRMYEESLQLSNGLNTQIMWSNIPLDSMLYIHDSPNYCDLDAVPRWPGMHGRQCLKGSSSEGIKNENDDEDNNSCHELCHKCGYRVRSQNVVTEHSCNCKFTWNFQVHCERCMNVKQEFYCY